MTISEKIAIHSLDSVMYTDELVTMGNIGFYLTVVRDNYGSSESEEIIKKLVKKIWLQENIE